MVIYEIERNPLEKIRIEISEYEGKRYLHLRTYFNRSDGPKDDWRPTRKGICLPLERADELQEGIQKLMAKIAEGVDLN